MGRAAADPVPRPQGLLIWAGNSAFLPRATSASAARVLLTGVGWGGSQLGCLRVKLTRVFSHFNRLLKFISILGIQFVTFSVVVFFHRHINMDVASSFQA